MLQHSTQLQEALQYSDRRKQSQYIFRHLLFLQLHATLLLAPLGAPAPLRVDDDGVARIDSSRICSTRDDGEGSEVGASRGEPTSGLMKERAVEDDEAAATYAPLLGANCPKGAAPSVGAAGRAYGSWKSSPSASSLSSSCIRSPTWASFAGRLLDAKGDRSAGPLLAACEGVADCCLFAADFRLPLPGAVVAAVAAARTLSSGEVSSEFDADIGIKAAAAVMAAMPEMSDEATQRNRRPSAEDKRKQSGRVTYSFLETRHRNCRPLLRQLYWCC